MRVHEWNVQLLINVAAVPRLRPDLQLHGQPDQNAMKYVFNGPGRKDNVLYQPRHWYNAYHKGKDNLTEIREGQGELLVHCAGFCGNIIAAMEDWFQKLEKEPDEHASPIEQTHMKQEVDEFWSVLREEKVLLQDMGHEIEQKNTSTQLKAFKKRQNAIRFYPWDKKRFGEAMRQTHNARDQEKQPKKEEVGNMTTLHPRSKKVSWRKRRRNSRKRIRRSNGLILHLGVMSPIWQIYCSKRCMLMIYFV